MKPQPEDIIWNTITHHARQKFDYTQFEKEFGSFENTKVLDAILFQILEGFAEHQAAEWIANNIRYDLGMLSYSFAEKDFVPFITNGQTLFDTEIKATALALSLFSDGKDIAEILTQVQTLLPPETD